MTNTAHQAKPYDRATAIMTEAEREAAWDSCAAQIGKASPFMRFWKVTNNILESRNQHELLYGEARDWWKQSQLQSLC